MISSIIPVIDPFNESIIINIHPQKFFRLLFDILSHIADTIDGFIVVLVLSNEKGLAVHAEEAFHWSAKHGCTRVCSVQNGREAPLSQRACFYADEIRTSGRNTTAIGRHLASGPFSTFRLALALCVTHYCHCTLLLSFRGGLHIHSPAAFQHFRSTI